MWSEMGPGLSEGSVSVFKHHLVTSVLLINPCNVTFRPNIIRASSPTPFPEYQGSLCLDPVALVVMLAVSDLPIYEHCFDRGIVHCHWLACN